MTSKAPDHQKTLRALANWLETTREHTPLLDDAADALLNQIDWLSYREQRNSMLAQQPRTLGLYGYSQAGKAELISILTGTEPGHIAVSPAGKPLNYLTHINPAHASPRIAIRFCAHPTRTTSDWPLTLRLFSETGLVQIFIQHHLQQHPAIRAPSDRQIQQRLQQLQPLCQPQDNPAVTQPEIAALANEWTQLSHYNLQPATWRQLITLLPQLNLSERAEIYALFWSEQHQLTRQWLQLAETLQALGNAHEVAASLNLIVDNFLLPAEGLLNGELSAGHLLVCPLMEDKLLPAVSVEPNALTFLVAELVLPLTSSPILPGTDLLDIPGAPAEPGLMQSKINFLLDDYRQRQQPDILLICNAADNIRTTSQTAARLLRWQQQTRPACNGAHPGLIWSITPHDLRFKSGMNPDESIQRLLGRPGELWATLQALESRNLQRMIEWLAAALSEQLCLLRHSALNNQLLHEVQQSFLPFTTPTKTTDNQALAQQAIRELQQQASHHGELLAALLPDAELLQSLCQNEIHQAGSRAQHLFHPDIDLFGDDNQAARETQVKTSDTARRIYCYWINHVRQWTQQPQHAQQLNLSISSLRWLGDTLITTSYRLQLDHRLQTASLQTDQAGAQLQAEIGNFISWLGYASVPLNKRPASRINKGAVIFQPAERACQCLTCLPDQPVHAVTCYVYDWLIGLYHHAQQNAGYRHPLDLKSTDRGNLKKILKKMTPAETTQVQDDGAIK